MQNQPARHAVIALFVVALAALTGCDQFGFKKQPPPPSGASVHQPPSQGSPPAPQGSMSVPPVTPAAPGDPAAP